MLAICFSVIVDEMGLDEHPTRTICREWTDLLYGVGAGRMPIGSQFKAQVNRFVTTDGLQIGPMRKRALLIYLFLMSCLCKFPHLSLLTPFAILLQWFLLPLLSFFFSQSFISSPPNPPHAFLSPINSSSFWALSISCWKYAYLKFVK